MLLNERYLDLSLMVKCTIPFILELLLNDIINELQIMLHSMAYSTVG